MNYKKIVLLAFSISFLLGACKDNSTNTQPVTYETVTIGTQVWMKKNLDVDHYRNGDPIPQVTDSIKWRNLSTGAWCYYKNSDSLGIIYGKLYNWYAVNDPRGIAPAGWHIASDTEFTILHTYLGGDSIAINKLKETGTVHWYHPNNSVTNLSGYTALPAGWRDNKGIYYAINDLCGWWTSNTFDDTHAIGRTFIYNDKSLLWSVENKVVGMSVRCVINSN